VNESFAKDTDGFFARHFDRKISRAISEVLLKTSVTPNQITVAVILIGVVAGVFLSVAGYAPKLLGSLLFLFSSILDGCDGEVARAKKMTSRLGGWLDFWGDNVVHVVVFYGLAIGLYKDTGRDVYLLLGTWAVLGTIASAALAGYQTYKKGESNFTSVVGDTATLQGSPWRKRLARISDALARRDFIYAVVLLALVGHLEWFLWPCAIGVNLYALVLLAMFLTS
jgi:phosphatidylglycerophosphate synthase